MIAVLQLMETVIPTAADDKMTWKIVNYVNMQCFLNEQISADGNTSFSEFPSPCNFLCLMSQA